VDGQWEGGEDTEMKTTVAPGRAPQPMAYFRVHSRAVRSNSARSVLKTCAISGMAGSSGGKSVISEYRDRSFLAIVSPGLQLMSRQEPPVPEERSAGGNQGVAHAWEHVAVGVACAWARARGSAVP
jgi:hypothetical protein